MVIPKAYLRKPCRSDQAKKPTPNDPSLNATSAKQVLISRGHAPMPPCPHDWLFVPRALCDHSHVRRFVLATFEEGLRGHVGQGAAAHEAHVCLGAIHPAHWDIGVVMARNYQGRILRSLRGACLTFDQWIEVTEDTTIRWNEPARQLYCPHLLE